MQAVILAGGFGTRLRPLTSTRPKPLIPFANEPFLLHNLRQLAASGFTEVVLSTMYLPEAFDELLPAARKAGVEVTLSSEDTPMGTSGAVKRLTQWPTQRHSTSSISSVLGVERALAMLEAPTRDSFRPVQFGPIPITSSCQMHM